MNKKLLPLFLTGCPDRKCPTTIVPPKQQETHKVPDGLGLEWALVLVGLEIVRRIHLTHVNT